MTEEERALLHVMETQRRAVAKRRLLAALRGSETARDELMKRWAPWLRRDDT